jgi:hypothetical protein
MRIHISPVKMALAFLGAEIADGEEGGQAGIGSSVRRVSQKAGAVEKIQAGGGDETETEFFCGGVGTDYAGKGVAVGKGKGGMITSITLLYEFFGM